ncbi:ERCC6L [Acanthosepion pharaonis]|uniref:ERCC6L n=1 Tax=Acanthosepion pharaonis TaxID=158019 RepID=A0A812CZ43_ACAPH|nr:ERCC6L [Sepia pharaonis]
MDESAAFVHVSDKEKIKALKLVVDADGYLAQRQLLPALNLYKESAEILPDPAIIRKIKKLRKYMKRNGMDLGEDKENQVDYINSGKQVSPDAITTPNNGNKSLRERVNFAVSSGNYPKDSPKSSEIITDHVANIKTENTSIKKQEDLDVIVTENKLLETASDCLPATVPENDDDDKKETQHKRDVRHQKPRLSSLDLKPEIPLDNAKSRLSKMAPPPATLDTPSSEKISPNSEDRIRSFKDLRKRMYPHQKEGMKWLARLFGEQKGGILGDDMGLGKTLQVIGYLYKMFEVNEIEHVLIVLPSALILPWQSEITRWAPNLNYATFHGKTRAGRMKLLHNLQREGGILLTTYGLIVTNYEELSKGPNGRQFIWDYVFLDEGHKIKNPTKTQKAAHYIPAHNRIIITGTPIQNNLVEMWSLFDFVHHGSLLGTIKTFKINYENPITRARQKDASLEEKQLGYTMSLNLQKIIAPYFLRRTKAELMADPDSGLPKLPRKNDIIVWVKMTADQKKVYESYLRLDEVKELMSSSRSPLVALNILKKICDHLRLLSVRICKALGMLTTEETRKYVQDRISHLDDPLEIPEWTRQPGAEEPATSIPTKQSKETDCAATQLTGIPDALLYKESSKLMIVIELLGYLSATGHKCLVFSQSTKMLDIIQQILINLHYRHVRMDGQITKLEQRAEIIRRFETNKDIHIFLLTTQVGGVGLNLTVADRIIIVDPSWNPAIDSQAVDRIYRIGQKKNVIIFRLITCGTVEEKIYIRQLFKLSINRQTTKESKDPFRYFTKQDLKQLFIVDDLSVSETQLQLAQMHANKRVSDEVVDDQIKFLESMNFKLSFFSFFFSFFFFSFLFSFSFSFSFFSFSFFFFSFFFFFLFLFLFFFSFFFLFFFSFFSFIFFFFLFYLSFIFLLSFFLLSFFSFIFLLSFFYLSFFFSFFLSFFFYLSFFSFFLFLSFFFLFLFFLFFLLSFFLLSFFLFFFFLSFFYLSFLFSFSFLFFLFSFFFFFFFSFFFLSFFFFFFLFFFSFFSFFFFLSFFSFFFFSFFLF